MLERFSSNKVRSISTFALLTLLMLNSFPSLAQKSNTNKQKLTLIYGDITVTNAGQAVIDTSKRTKSSGSVELSGRPLVTFSSGSTGAVYQLQADNMKGSNLGNGKSEKAILEMSGNLTYKLRQPIKNVESGENVVEGTASRGVFDRAKNLLTLYSANATLNAPDLISPDKIRSPKLVADLSQTPNIYSMEGDAERNSLTISPVKPKLKAGEKVKKNALSGFLRLRNFSSGRFQRGIAAHIQGNGTVAEFDNPDNKTEIALHANDIKAEFDGAIAENIKSVTAKGALRYRLYRPKPEVAKGIPEKQGEQELQGTGSELRYDYENRIVSLNGAVDATLKETVQLLEPARLKAKRLTFSTEEPFKYELKGSPEESLVSFRLRPPKLKEAPPTQEPAATEAEPGATAEPEAEKVPKQTFLSGSVTLTGFETAVFEPGKSVSCNAPNKMNLQLDAKDTETLSVSRVSTHEFLAVLNVAGELVSAKTNGSVKFYIQQRKSASKTTSVSTAQKRNGKAQLKPASILSPQRVMQSFAGVASNLVYKGVEQDLILVGPYETTFTDPELFAEPAIFKGEAGDTITRQFVKEKLIWDSPNRTSTTEAFPKAPPKKEKL